jgi:hypothetical protein
MTTSMHVTWLLAFSARLGAGLVKWEIAGFVLENFAMEE